METSRANFLSVYLLYSRDLMHFKAICKPKQIFVTMLTGSDDVDAAGIPAFTLSEQKQDCIVG